VADAGTRREYGDTRLCHGTSRSDHDDDRLGYLTRPPHLELRTEFGKSINATAD
jgi:hypothetical protein